MKLIALSGALMLGLLSAHSANAASIYAGQARAAAVCSQCHGIKTPSADAPFPPLADVIMLTLNQRSNNTAIKPVNPTL